MSTPIQWVRTFAQFAGPTQSGLTGVQPTQTVLTDLFPNDTNRATVLQEITVVDD